MNKFLQRASFRLFNVDETGGGGSESVLDLADAAYEAVVGGEEPAEPAEPEVELAGEEVPEGAEDEPVRDLEGGAEAAQEESDALALDAEFAKANPELAEAYGEQLSTLRRNIDAVAPMLAFEQQLGDPESAPVALRHFADAVAKLHGQDLASMLGLSSPTTDPEESSDWRSMGFESKDEFKRAPEWQRLGFDSPNELRLDRELRELRALIAPSVEAQKAAAESTRRAETKSRFEAAVKSAAPAAIASLRAEHNWKVTEAQAIEAATRFPQLAAQDLKSAILATFPVELAKHYGAAAERKTERRMPEMPQGNDQNGVKVPNPETASISDLAEFAYAQI